jgi:hypothetical protein
MALGRSWVLQKPCRIIVRIRCREKAIRLLGAVLAPIEHRDRVAYGFLARLDKSRMVEISIHSTAPSADAHSPEMGGRKDAGQEKTIGGLNHITYGVPDLASRRIWDRVM